MKLYQELNVSEFAQIQKETLSFIDTHPEVLRPDSETEYFAHVPLNELPVLEAFLKTRVKTKINETSICFVPPKFSTALHIDGIRKDNNDNYRNIVTAVINEKHPNLNTDSLPIANQFVLIIPIANYDQTTSYWYTNELNDEDETVYQHTREQYPYQFFISFAKDYVVKDPIGTTKIKQPTFIRSDLFHNVKNESEKTRIVAVIRFMEYQHYQSVEDIFDCKGLL